MIEQLNQKKTPKQRPQSTTETVPTVINMTLL